MPKSPKKRTVKRSRSPAKKSKQPKKTARRRSPSPKKKVTRRVIAPGKKKAPPPEEDDDDETSSEEDSFDDDDEDESDSDYESDSQDEESYDSSYEARKRAIAQKTMRKVKAAAAAARRGREGGLSERAMSKIAEAAAERAAARAVERHAASIRESAIRAVKKDRKRAALAAQDDDDDDDDVVEVRVKGREAGVGRVVTGLESRSKPYEVRMAGKVMRPVSKNPKVVHEQVGGGGGSSGPTRIGGGGSSKVVHEQLNPVEMRRMFRPPGRRGRPTELPWSPEDEARSQWEEGRLTEDRMAMSRKLQKLMSFEGSADQKCQHIIDSIGGEAALVVGQRYEPQPDAVEALRQLCKVCMCRKTNPTDVVVTLHLTQARYVSKVYCGGQEIHTEEGLSPDGSFEDPVLRAARNAAAMAELRFASKKKSVDPVASAPVEVYDVDDDDDIDLDD